MTQPRRSRPAVALARVLGVFALLAATLFSANPAMAAACYTGTVRDVISTTGEFNMSIQDPSYYNVKTNPNVTYQVARQGFQTVTPTYYQVQYASTRTEYQFQYRNSTLMYTIEPARFITVQDYRTFWYDENLWEWVSSVTHSNNFTRRTSPFDVNIQSCLGSWAQAQSDSIDCHAGHNLPGYKWNYHWNTNNYSQIWNHYQYGPTWGNTGSPVVSRGYRVFYNPWTHGPIGTAPPRSELGNIWQKRDGFDASRRYDTQYLPGGTRDVDYRVANTYVNYGAWTAPFWTANWPNAIPGIDMMFNGTRTVKYFPAGGATTTMANLPSTGVQGVDWQVTGYAAGPSYSVPTTYYDWVTADQLNGRPVLATNYDFSKSTSYQSPTKPVTGIENQDWTATRITPPVRVVRYPNPVPGPASALTERAYAESAAKDLATSGVTNVTYVPGTYRRVLGDPRTVELRSDRGPSFVMSYGELEGQNYRLEFANLSEGICRTGVNPT
jgi:hypothetical protein